MKLFFYEFRKLFSNKWILLALLGIIFLPSFLVPIVDRYNQRYIVIDNTGNSISDVEYEKQNDKIAEENKGDLLDPVYSAKIEKNYEIALLMERIDLKKVENYLGRKPTAEELWNMVEEFDESFFYDPDSVMRSSYYFPLIHTLHDFNQRFQKPYYENYYEEYRSTNKNKEVLQKDLNQEIEKVKHAYVGSSLSFESLFSIMNITSVCLAFFFLLVSPAMFNKEDKDKVIGLLKTTKKGKRRIALAKIGVLVTLSIGIPLICTAFSTLVIHVTEGLYNWNITALYFSKYSIHHVIHTAFGIYLIRILLMILGCLAASSIGSVLSTIFKNSYVSLGIMIISYVACMFLPYDVELGFLTPYNMLMDTYGFLGSDPVYFLKQVFYPEELAFYTWIIGSLILFMITYFIYKRKQVTNE